jgi:Subtilase family
MNARRLALAALFALSACASKPPAEPPVAAPPAAGDATASATLDDSRTLLVMMRLPPSHYRPDGGYSGGYDNRAARAALMRVARRLAHDNGLTLISEYAMPAVEYDCFVMRTGDPGRIDEIRERLAHDPEVSLVQRLQTFRSLAHNDPLYPLQPAGEAWHLAALHGVTTGRSVPIASIDTGVESGHPDLAGQIATSQNFVDAGPVPAEMHGTAVAGIIAGRADNALGIAGVAPRSRLLALRACWQLDAAGSASCNSFTLAKAMQFAIERSARVINLSLTGPSDPLLERLVSRAVQRGIVVVGAVDPALSDGGFPASLPDVIAVASDAEQRRPPTHAIVAPGKDVPVPLPGGRWGFVSGSSFSTAEVSGMVALMRELAPGWTPGQIRSALTAHRARESAGGSLDPCGAIRLTGGTCVCDCVDKKQEQGAVAR